MSNKQEKLQQIELESQARELGKQANINGKNCVPAQDAEFVKLLSGKQPGKQTLAIITAWQRGFIQVNLDKPFEF